MGNRFFGAFSSLVIAVALILTGCSDSPRHKLTDEEKIADMYWLFSQFKNNYAPLEFKQKKYNFNYDQLKAKYLAEIPTAKTNEDFYRLMHKFVAEFRDAHTSGSVPSSSLPNRTKVSYLGFDGVRSGDQLIVKKLLPTISSSSKYPIKVGDKITKLDGVPLADIVKNEYVYYRNLGQEQSNLTYHFPRIFNRNSLIQKFSDKKDAVVTVKRGTKEEDITLPWVEKDLFQFSKEQSEAAGTNRKTTTNYVGSIEESLFFSTGLKALNGEIKLSPKIIKTISRLPGYDYRKSFNFIDTMPTWSSEIIENAFREVLKTPRAATPQDTLKATRNIPSDAIFLAHSTTYPTYITTEKVLDKDGKPTGATKQVAYMNLDTFSPDDDEKTVLSQVQQTLKLMKAFGVKDIIIDMINNGGGSLSLGVGLAQLFSPKRIIAPEIQFKLSDTWIDEFESTSLNGNSDAEKELARRVFVQLAAEQEKGAVISQKFDYEALSPFTLKGNPDIEESPKVYLLVNEMCASMCDIFTAVLKDNGIATIIGSKTMGAGGNVVRHQEAPNSHYSVNQTESLILRKDGSELENGGVEADTAIAVTDSADEKYEPVRRKAIELIVKQTAQDERPPAPALPTPPNPS